MNYLLIGGILLNSALIIFNRFIKRLPDKIYFPIAILAIGCIIIGAFLNKC